MTSRARRLTLILGVAALVAALAGVAMAPGTAAAPGNGKGGTADPTFIITTKQPVYYYGGTGLGTFKAAGAIRDSGYADGDTELWLSGKHGMIHIELYGGTFAITDATTAYEHTVGATGTHTCVFEWGGEKGRPKSDGLIVGTLTRTLEGSIPR